MALHLETVVVPWFSRQEWLEVYHGTFGNDVECWKEARDTMLVWQARVRKLPIGVDLTLPLLQSKIVSADPCVDADVKSIMQGTALQRFVSNVVKLPQTQYYGHQTLHKLAAEIGLPGHLVDLRNEIIHGDSGYAGGCTVVAGLETAFRWIEKYYWKRELAQMNKEVEERHQMPSKDKSDFHRSLNDYASSVLEDAQEGSYDDNKSLEFPALAVEMFQYFYARDPQGCIDAVVECVLMPLGQQCKSEFESRRMSKCGCIFKMSIIKSINMFLNAILTSNGSTQLMLNSLLRKVQGNIGIASDWILLLVTSLIKYPAVKGKNKVCRKHVLSLKKNGVKWKRIVCKLLAIEDKWAIDLATRILNSSDSNIPESQVKNVKNLLDISSHVERDDDDDEVGDISCSMSEDELFDVESVMEHINENNPETCRVSRKLQAASLHSCEIGAMTPLGILPHQVHNKAFYKDLLLHYPDEEDFESPAKRQKT